jgi:hypothetical protein
MPVHKQCHRQAQQNTDMTILRNAGFESYSRDSRKEVREQYLWIMQQSPLRRKILLDSLTLGMKRR